MQPHGSFVQSVEGEPSSGDTRKLRQPRNPGARPGAITSLALIRRAARRLLQDISHPAEGEDAMRRIALGAALLLFAVGCGSSGSGVCDDLGNAYNNLKTKFSACGTLSGDPFPKDQCVEAYNNSHCTDAEKQVINDFVKCLNNMPSCTPATETAWGDQLQNCVDPLLGVNC